MAGKYALVIGNAAYEDQRILNLRRPAVEAKALSRVLSDSEIGDFDVKFLHDSSVDTMRREIARLFSKRAKDDLVLLYFSGHGLKDEAGDLHLAAQDTELDLLGGAAVPASFVKQQMSRSRSRRQILILDCCFSGAFSSGIKGAATVGTASAFRGDGFGHVVLTATDSIQYSWEDPADDEDDIDGSVFTHYLIHGLETGEADLGGDGKIDLDELYDYVYEKVVELTPRQTPGKWTYKQQGVVVIADSPRTLTTKAPSEFAPTTPTRQSLWTHGSPFRGLRPFEAEHAPIFRGRERAIRDVMHKLGSRAESGCAFLLILGMSGVGKSSLLRAGVLPRLAEAGDGARQAILRPSDAGGDVFRALSEALLRPDALPDLAEAAVDDLARALRTSPSAALMMLKGALKHGDGTTARLLLLVDQLEELFAPEIDDEDRRRFMETLEVFSRQGDIWILATLRSDFYARCNEIDALMKLKSDGGQYDLLIPSAAEIGQMIRMPARAAGLTFEEKDDVPLSDLLRDAAVRNRQALPLLQFALEELYKGRTGKDVLTYAAYERLGGMEGALARRAEEVFDAATTQQQTELPRMLRALVRLDADEALSRRSVSIASFNGASRALVGAFVEARLLVTETGENDEATVSVAHEALLEHWPRLRDCIANDREALRVRGRVAAEASLWREKGRTEDFLLQQGIPVLEAEELLTSHGSELTSEEREFIQASSAKSRRFQQIKQAVVSALLVLTIAAGTAAFYANGERIKAVANQRLAEANEARAENESKTSKRITEFMIDLFTVSRPGPAAERNTTPREMLDRGAREIESELSGEPELQAALMLAMGRVYMALGLPDDAVGLFRESLRKSEDVHGLKSLESAEIIGSLAEELFNQGKYPEAQEMAEEALEIRIAHLGEEHLDVARSWNDMGALRYIQGDLSGAEEFYGKALKIRRAQLPEGHRSLEESLNNLAVMLRFQRKFDEAEAIYREMLRQASERDGVVSEAVSTVQNNLAFVLLEREDYEEAESLYRENLDLHRKLIDPSSKVRTPMSQYNLARLLRETGRYDESKSLLEDALETDRKVLSPTHSRVLGGEVDLADILISIGRAEEARGLAGSAVDSYLASLPEDHWRVAKAQSVLGASLVALGDFAGAETLLLPSRQVLESKRGAEARITRDALARIVKLYAAWGRSQEKGNYEKMLHELEKD